MVSTTSLRRMTETQHWRGFAGCLTLHGVNAGATRLTLIVTKTPPPPTQPAARKRRASPGESMLLAKARVRLADAVPGLGMQAWRGAQAVPAPGGREKPAAGGPPKSDPLPTGKTPPPALTPTVSPPVTLSLHIPLKTISGMNAREHPMQRHRRVASERDVIAWNLAGFARQRPTLPTAIRLTRYAPSRGLDSDNLQSALKPTRDAIAQWLGINDADESQARYVYAQAYAKGYAVRIEFIPMEQPA